MPGRSATRLLCGLLLVICTACRVDVEVGLDARSDGSGQVRVEVVADRAVAEAIDLSKGVRADDLRQAGWQVDGPTPRTGGGVGIVATKPFADPAGARLVIDELTGADGAFQGFRLEHTRTFARTTTRFAGTVDLAKGVEAFGDAGVRSALGGSDIGVDLATIEKLPLDQALGVRVTVNLPGEIATNAPSRLDGAARWDLALRDRTELTAESAALNTTNLAAAVALLAGIGLLLVFLTGRRS